MTEENKSSTALVLVAWIFVGLPLGWGVYNTVKNSMKLFQQPAAPPHSLRMQAQPVPRRNRVA